MDISVNDAITATGGKLFSGNLNASIRSVSTDTRTIEPGQCFVALKGENFDGHDYLAEAVVRGAATVVAAHSYPDLPNVNQIIVPDTLKALGDMAAFCRNRHKRTPLAAIVGSSGKTTAKEMAARIVGPSHSLLVTRGNLNNLIGVPHMLFELSPRNNAVILELGMNQAGELQRLTEISSPDCLILLNILNAHVGNFGSQEGLYQAKCDSLRDLRPDTQLIMNADDPLSIRARKEFAGDRKVTTFGLGPDAEITARNIEPLEPYGYRFTLSVANDETALPVEMRMFGRHNIYNALAAAAIGRFFGVSAAAIALHLCEFRPGSSRSEVEELHGWHIIKDYYNASPAAVESALRSLREFHVPGKRYAVLADMLELGPDEAMYHKRAGEAAAEAGLDLLITLGQRGLMIADAAKANGARVESLGTAEEAVARLREILHPGDLLLIKGSRLMKLERIYDLLKGGSPTPHS
ncbi:MAG: UDP-N-acetylmuramoyl-tripeptide--D-alanyl-D-alanine ligase [Candidatus Sumerlaeaceae bacterium]|nr:UDP-N-acetylmuramoyl-tripeptide--D-alanyl-D-alanine ligase [Candidatus Sumerlaeaceae bacterium]